MREYKTLRDTINFFFVFPEIDFYIVGVAHFSVIVFIAADVAYDT